MIYAKNNFKQLKVQLRKGMKAAPKAQQRASYRAAQMARTEMVRAARETYLVTAKSLRETMDIKKNSESYSIVSRGGMLALTRFKVGPNKNPNPPKRPKNGLNVTIKRGQKHKLDKSGFVARMKSGHVNVFFRSGKSSLPIEPRFGPGAPIMLGNEEVVQRGKDTFDEVSKQRFAHELDRLIGGK